MTRVIFEGIIYLGSNPRFLMPCRTIVKSGEERNVYGHFLCRLLGPYGEGYDQSLPIHS